MVIRKLGMVCFGIPAGDLTFTSDYSIIYKVHNEEYTVQKLPSLIFIQPSAAIIPFHRVSFANADMYLLTPQYDGDHELVCYAIAIDLQSNRAIPLQFINQNGEPEVMTYSSRTMPVIENEQLIVQPGISGGSSEQQSKKKHYKLDMRKGELIEQP
ncbi:hypothetical protein [Paenibacillus sp. Z6-24]